MGSWGGNLIRLVRRDRGLTQRELARRAKTSQAAIAAYEAGRRSPTLETLARIVRAAGADLRIRLEPLDDHDEWMARYEERLPPRVRAARRTRDRQLMVAAAATRQTKSRPTAGRRRGNAAGR